MMKYHSCPHGVQLCVINAHNSWQSFMFKKQRSLLMGQEIHLRLTGIYNNYTLQKIASCKWIDCYFCFTS